MASLGLQLESVRHAVVEQDQVGHACPHAQILEFAASNGAPGLIRNVEIDQTGNAAQLDMLDHGPVDLGLSHRETAQYQLEFALMRGLPDP